ASRSTVASPASVMLTRWGPPRREGVRMTSSSVGIALRFPERPEPESEGEGHEPPSPRSPAPRHQQDQAASGAVMPKGAGGRPVAYFADAAPSKVEVAVSNRWERHGFLGGALFQGSERGAG